MLWDLAGKVAGTNLCLGTCGTSTLQGGPTVEDRVSSSGRLTFVLSWNRPSHPGCRSQPGYLYSVLKLTELSRPPCAAGWSRRRGLHTAVSTPDAGEPAGWDGRARAQAEAVPEERHVARWQLKAGRSRGWRLLEETALKVLGTWGCRRETLPGKRNRTRDLRERWRWKVVQARAGPGRRPGVLWGGGISEMMSHVAVLGSPC